MMPRIVTTVVLPFAGLPCIKRLLFVRQHFQMRGIDRDKVRILVRIDRHLRNEADAYRNDILPKAHGEAQRIIQEAEAYKEQVTDLAQGEAKRFTSVYQSYKAAPDVTAAARRNPISRSKSSSPCGPSIA